MRILGLKKITSRLSKMGRYKSYLAMSKMRGEAGMEATFGKCPKERRFFFGSVPLAGDAFATSGTAYPSGRRSRTPSMEEPGPPVRSRSPKFIPQQEWVQKMKTEEGAKEMRSTAEAKTGSCPVCKEKHAYHRKLTWGSLSWPSSRLHD